MSPDNTVRLRLSNEDFEKFEELAAKEHHSIDEYIESILLEHLQEAEQEHKAN